MNKKELIIKIEQRFKTGTKFFKWLEYKNPSQSWYQFKNNDRVDLAMVKLFELILLTIDRHDRLKDLYNDEINKRFEIKFEGIK